MVLSLSALQKKQEKQAKDLTVISKDIGLVHGNQVELAKSEERLDDQFAVLTRLTVTKLNEMFTKFNALVQGLPAGEGELLTEQLQEALGIGLVGYNEINEMFIDWGKFRKRSDFRDHTKAWYTGVDLDSLPPPPEPEAKETEESDPSPEAEAAPAEGDQDEGPNSNSGNETAIEEPSEGSSASQDNEVPEVQDAHKAAS